MKEIPVSNGLVTIVDDEDYLLYSSRKWQLSGGPPGYASRCIGQTTIYLHRLIMNAAKGIQVDHKNRNTLDNRRENLRLCTQSQNNANSRSLRSSSSELRGVCWDSGRQKWLAYIGHEPKILGRFDDERKAAVAYNTAALKRFGEFATLNMVEA